MMKINRNPAWMRNICGDAALRLLRATYPKENYFYAVSWLAAKMNCFDLINQKVLLKKVIESRKRDDSFSTGSRESLKENVNKGDRKRTPQSFSWVKKESGYPMLPRMIPTLKRRKGSLGN